MLKFKTKDKSLKPERRHSLPSSNTNTKKGSKEQNKSTNSSPNKTARKSDVLSTENLISAKELLQAIQQYRRDAQEWMDCKTETKSQPDKDPDATPNELDKRSIVTQTVAVEVHQFEVQPSEIQPSEVQRSEKTYEKARKKRARNRTKSHESVVRFADEPLEDKKLSNRKTVDNKALEDNLKLLATGKLISQSSEDRARLIRAVSLPGTSRSNFLFSNYPVKPVVHPYLNALFQDYSKDYDHDPPPPPAPPDPGPSIRNDLGGAHSNNVFPITSDSSRLRETRILSEHGLDDFLPYRRTIEIYKPGPLLRTVSAEFGIPRAEATRANAARPSLWHHDIPGPYEIAAFLESFPFYDKVELPKVSQPSSPIRQLEWLHGSSIDIPYPNGISFIPEPLNRSYTGIPEHHIDIPHHQLFGTRAPEPQRRSYDRGDSASYQRPVEERFFESRPRSTPPREGGSSDYLQLSPIRRPRPRREPRPPPTSRLFTSSVKFFVSCFDVLDSLESRLRMNQLGEHERKIIIEFCHLLEKSKQLFNGLRELPQYGHKQWHSYFGRTFDVYTKLWKFQQQHRNILDGKYGLKRWQIGEIASKIGQLYYHFYLRTSETAYLHEAYAFYYAIRGRSYYTHASKEDKCELMVKNLRYYARFIVASLLLKKIKLVKELIKELERHIVEYGNTYDPDDQNEWQIVADEVKAFIKAEPVVVVLHPDDYAVSLTHRLTPLSTPPVDRSPVMNLSLQEALIVGSNSAQVKFSELTMDMFRMLQTLEREPTGDSQHMYDESPRQRYISTPNAASRGYNLENNRSDSPHKYLLFKPTPNQIFVYLASACDDLPPNGVVLLYISAEGLIVPPTKHPADSNGFDVGGLITSSRAEIVHKDVIIDGKLVQQKHRELQVFHPGDLYPFLRRPMFLIIDSDNSFIFHDLPRYFGQPLVVLMSPLEQPSSLHPTVGDKRAEGSLFTLFLHCPLSAFCFCCDIDTFTLGHWERAQTFIVAFLAEASQIVTRSRLVDPMYLSFMGDDFLRLLILRFIFCETFLRMHRLFRGRTQRTRCSPPLPDDLFEHPGLTHIIIDLATHFQVRGNFHDPSGVPAAPPSNRE